MRKIHLLLMLVMPVFWQCSNNDDKPAEPEKKPESTHYSNPVLNTSMPDPTIIKAANGAYYIYATEDTRNMPIYTSKDLVSWTYAGTVFNDATRPNFEPGGGLWAPDINYINGKYVLYYSMSVWGGETTCGIGVATATDAAGPFRDHGKLFRSGEIGVQNSIDPFYIEEDGKKYLFWGRGDSRDIALNRYKIVIYLLHLSFWFFETR